MPKANKIKKNALSPTVLIVGGAGFIGSHLAEALLAKDIRVVVIDNFSTGKDVFINSLLQNPNFALFNADVNQGVPEEIESVDYIFYLAGFETYLFDKEDLNLNSLLTNALGIKNVLDYCEKVQAKMVLASSVDVYQGVLSPLSLDHYFGGTVEQEKKYSLIEAKRYAEALVWEYYKRDKIDVRIARFSEVYGPRMNLLSAAKLGEQIQRLINKEDLVIFGEGTESEYYLYVQDAVSALIKSLFSDNTIGQIYTFRGNEPHSVLELTYLLKSLASSEINVLFKPKVNEFTTANKIDPDVSNLAQISWKPTISFKEGIIGTLKWLGYSYNTSASKKTNLAENGAGVQKDEILSLISPADPEDSNIPLAKKPNFSLKLKFKGLSGGLKSKLVKLKPRRSQKKQSKVVELGNSVEKVSEEPRASRTKAKKIVIPLTVVFVSLFVFVGVPVFQTLYYVKSGMSSLERAEEELMSLEAGEAQRYSNKAFESFHKGQVSLNRLNWLATVTGQRDLLNDGTSSLVAASYMAKSSYFVSKGIPPFISFWEHIKPASETELSADQYSEATLHFVTAKNNMELAKAEMKGVQSQKILAKYSAFEEDLTHAENSLETLVALSSNFADLVGIEEDRRYLVLFQNSNEIRPTGGFIGSYAIVELSNGKIEELFIDDIYNPDGQIDLRELDVTPPLAIQTHLEEERLHIRNANWDPDFLVSSQQIEDLFFKLDGSEFDGVIALDLHFVEDILDVTGPVFLTAYNEEITSQNLYEKAQFHSEFNYENGSDQKRSFLTILGGKVLERLFSFESSDVLNLTSRMSQSLNARHLIISIPDNELSALLSEKGWDGRMVQTDGDYLSVINANVGGTKANYFVKNEMTYGVYSKTRDGLLRAELLLEYEHTGEDNSWPGGPYKNNVRVYTKKGAKLTGANAVYYSGEEEESENIFDAVAVNETADHTVFEFVFVLEPTQKIGIDLEYDLSEELSFEKNTSFYNLYWQKQAGTHDDNIYFSFASPFSKAIKSSQPPMQLGNNSASYSSVLNADLSVTLELD